LAGIRAAAAGEGRHCPMIPPIMLTETPLDFVPSLEVARYLYRARSSKR
jgi:hypothetical protein